MGNSDDEHEISLDRVKNAVRKNSGKAATNVLVERTPARWVFEDDFDGVLDTNDEPEIQTGLLLCIVVSGFVVFFERLRVELISHRPSERRTRASASSPGIV